jgi:hypothetical protein
MLLSEQQVESGRISNHKGHPAKWKILGCVELIKRKILMEFLPAEFSLNKTVTPWSCHIQEVSNPEQLILP